MATEVEFKTLLNALKKDKEVLEASIRFLKEKDGEKTAIEVFLVFFLLELRSYLHESVDFDPQNTSIQEADLIPLLPDVGRLVKRYKSIAEKADLSQEKIKIVFESFARELYTQEEWSKVFKGIKKNDLLLNFFHLSFVGEN